MEAVVSSSDEEYVYLREQMLENILSEVLGHPLFDFVSGVFINCVASEMSGLGTGKGFVGEGLNGRIASVFFNCSNNSKDSDVGHFTASTEDTACMEYYSDWIFVSIGRAFPETTLNLLTLFSFFPNITIILRKSNRLGLLNNFLKCSSNLMNGETIKRVSFASHIISSISLIRCR